MPILKFRLSHGYPMTSPNDSVIFTAFQRYSANPSDVRLRENVLEAVSERVDALSRAMLRANNQVNRWDQTQDIAQIAKLKLWRALDEVTITDHRHLLNLAGMHIRNTIKDHYRKYQGAEGIGRHHFTESNLTNRSDDYDAPASPLLSAGKDNSAIDSLELHELVDRLSEEERETFNMLYYSGLTHAEAASTLGVAEKTIQRRWRRARLALAQMMGVECFDDDAL